MLDPRSRLAMCMASVLTSILFACTHGDAPSLGTARRLNEVERGAASFSFLHFADVVSSGDRVATAYMTLNGQTDRNVVVRTSRDGGASWSNEFALNAPEYGDTISVAPQLILDDAGAVLAVWQARRNRVGQKFILSRRSPDFGETWETTQLLNSVPQSFPPGPGLAAKRDGRVLVAFSDERNIERDIFVNRSIDGGKTWLPKDVTVDSPRKTESVGPAAALGEGGDAWVLWEEKQKHEPVLLVARSQDGGQTWGPPKRVDPVEREASPIWPGLVAVGGRLTAVWTAGLVGDTMRSWLWVASSTDGGETWSTPLRFYEGSAQAAFHLLAEGSTVYLAWNGGDAEGTHGIYFNASDDGGATWRHPVDRPMRVDNAPTKEGVGRPQLALGSDGSVVLVWQENDRRIVLRSSKDGGRTWQGDPVVVASTDKNRLGLPVASVSGRTAWVVWVDWADTKGSRKTLADVDKGTPLDAYVRKVTLP